jgi:ABC-type nitrate/sulfonate/bicarbonate transport system substrate-binding protein
VRLLSSLAAACLSALALAACGGTSNSGTDDASLLLDFTPNAVHTGIYTALARDFDGAEGVRMRVRTPSDSTDPVRLLTAGRVDLAVMSISDLAIAREGGADLVGVMALVQRPLAAVLAQPSIRSPRDLEGRRVGVTGLPSDVAVLDSIVRGAGGDPAKVRRTTIGFAAVPSLLSRRVQAATGFWNAEGVALRRERRGPGRFRTFRVEQFGAPPYPELVVVATATTLQDDPDLAPGLVAALRRGYDEALLDPDLAVETLVRRNRGLERGPVLEELQAVQGAFRAGGRFGELDPGRLRAWARWAKRSGLVDEEPDVDLAFRPRIANATAQSEED